MSDLAGLPTPVLARAAVLVLGGVVLAMLLLAWRRPLLLRWGLRAVSRRKLRTALIVLGLTTSTAVITTAIGTGEMMARTIQTLVAGGVGPVDLVITTPVRGSGSAPGLRDPGALLSGADLVAGEFFPAERAEQLRWSLAGDPDLAALTPAIQVQATAISPQSGRARAGLNVVGLPVDQAGFGRFHDARGQPITVADLEPGQALINREGARLLDAQPGAALALRLAGRAELSITLTAVVQDGDLSGMQAAVYLPLPQLQTVLGHNDQINQILLATTGSGGSEERSRRLAGHIRLALADRDLLAAVAAGLATEAGQSQLRALEGRVRPEARPAVRRLRDAARSGEPTATLAYYVADPLLTTEYRWILNAASGQPALRGRPDPAGRLAPLTVLEVKQRALQAAGEYGSAVTSVFLILGLFSIAASLLLVFLIFVMLAAERRTEMGLARAVGAQRRHLIVAFAVEGLVYDLTASLVGLVLGVATGAAVLQLVQRALDRWDVTLRGGTSPAGLLLAFCLGVLVTFATVLLAAWRVSGVNIIAAIHGFGEPPARPRSGAGRRRHVIKCVIAVAVLALAGTTLLVGVTSSATLRAVGGALLVAAAAAAAAPLLAAAGMPARRAARLIAGLGGPAIALCFALAVETPATVHDERVLRVGAAGFVLAGAAMALAMVWVAGVNLDALLAPLRWLARPFGALAPATRIAVAYPLTHPFRTGLTASMFALVFLTMVTATALLRSTESAYVRRDGGAGFDLRATFLRPPADLQTSLSDAGSVRQEDFALIGGQAHSAVEALWPLTAAAVWRPLDLRVGDDALLSGSTGEMVARAEGFDSDAAVWRALRESPGAAIIGRRDLDAVPGLRQALYRQSGAAVSRFTPVPVWLRDPRGGPARRLTVIGVPADGSILSRGLLTGTASVAGMPAADQAASEFFFRLTEGVSLRTAATGVEVAFPERGVRTRILGEEARTAHDIRRLLDLLIRGFLGMGLLSGIAALAVIGMRSVAERRQQIGMLRALGFSRRSVQASFLLEGSVVAVLGLTCGAISGLILSRNIVAFLARDFTQLRLVVPWGQIAAIAAAAYGAALVSALAVAWQAGRVAPAEALRYE